MTEKYKDYPIKTETILLDYLSDLTEASAKELIGAKIIKVEGEEYSLELTLDNGKVLIISGHTYEDSALGVELVPVGSE